MSGAWRQPTDNERRLIEKLLSRDFPGRDALRVQLEAAHVLTIDKEGSLQFRASGPSADVKHRVLAEGYYLDRDGVENGPVVNVLLHVVDGMLNELEIYKDDGSAVERTLEELDVAELHLV